MKTEQLVPAVLISLLVVQLAFLGILLLRINAISHSIENIDRILLSTTNIRPLVEDFVPDVSADGSPYKGSLEAPVEIVEFADFTCSACRAVQPILEELLKRYEGQVTLIYRYFPLGAEGTDAFGVAVAAECAAQQGAFWGMHDFLFSHQGALSGDSFLRYAVDLGLDETAFAECLISRDAPEKVQNDIAAGQIYGVQATPTFFVNGRKVTGTIPMSVFERLVKEAIGVN